MTEKIDIRKIDRKKLGEKLDWGDRPKIKERLRAKGISVSEQTISNAFNPKLAIGHKTFHVIKETIRYLSDKEQTYQVAAAAALARELRPEEA